MTSPTNSTATASTTEPSTANRTANPSSSEKTASAPNASDSARQSPSPSGTSAGSANTARTSPAGVPIGQPNARSTDWIRRTVYTALFAALFVAFGSISIPLGFSPVPITLQTLAVMLAGGLLGATYGFWSLAIVVLLTAVGLPLMQGHGGMAVIYGATGGFIWMFPFAALLIGWVSDLLFRSSRRLTAFGYAVLAVSIFAFGVLLVYAGGVPWLAHYAHYSFGKAMSTGCYPFLIGDTIKTVAAVILIGALRPLVPGLLPKPRRSETR